jgi:two-component system nitrate/nitrite response regulator NarL
VISADVIAQTRAYREALAAAFEADGRVKLSYVSGYSDDALAAARTSYADVVLLQLPLAQGLSAARVLTMAPDSSALELAETKVVVFGVADADEVAAWAQAGVVDCIDENASLDDLITAVVRTAQGDAVASASDAGTLGDRVEGIRDFKFRTRSVLLSKLTAREIEIARLLVTGLSNKQIARQLVIEISTVKNHVHNILTKLGISHRAEIAKHLGARPAAPALISPQRASFERPKTI